MVCFIHRPEYYKILEDEKGNSLVGLAEIIIAKHRNGAVGDVRLRFKSEFAKFMNIEDDVKLNEFVSNINQPNEPAPIGNAEDFVKVKTSDDSQKYPF